MAHHTRNSRSDRRNYHAARRSAGAVDGVSADVDLRVGSGVAPGSSAGAGASSDADAARSDLHAYRRGSGRYAARSRRRSPWRVVFWAAIAVMAVAVAALAYVGFTYWSGQRAYDDIAREYVEVPDGANGASAVDGALPLSDFAVDWDALRAVNPDVVGWIYLPDTEVSYPIVHRDGDDSYYLNHTFSGDTAGSFGADFGCIMLSGENSADFSDQVNVVYGHNMANGSMFALLAGFSDSDAFNRHRTIYVLTPDGSYRLTTFAVNRVSEADLSIVVPKQNSAELLEYVQNRLDASLVVPDPASSAVADISQVFAFSTCDGTDNTYRIITFAEVAEYQPAGGQLADAQLMGGGSDDASTHVAEQGGAGEMPAPGVAEATERESAAREGIS